MPRNVEPLLKVLLLVVIYLHFSPSLVAQKVLSENEGAGIVNRAVILPRGEFNTASAEALCRQFVSEQTGKALLYRLSIAPNVDDWAQFQVGRGPTALNTPDGLAEYVFRVIGWPREPVAQVIGIKKQALFSYRDKTGLTEKILLGTSDPTLFRVGQVKYRLLHFFFEPGGKESLPSSSYHLNLYFQGPEVNSIANGLTLTKKMAVLTGTRNVFVRIHRNSWVMDDIYFPYLYPFVSELSFPKPSDYSDGSDLFCFAFYNRPSICKYGSSFLKSKTENAEVGGRFKSLK